MNEILVTVICNTYNHGNYIRDALEGFVNQKTKYKYEVIVHDDASTDNTADVIREYAEKYPDIIFPIYEKENQYSRLKKEHRGGITQLICFPKARGKYICFCEGDDYWIDDQLIEKKVAFLEAHPEYCAYLHRTKYYSCDKEQFIGHSNDSNIEYDYTFLDAIYLRSHTTGWMIRKEIYYYDLPEKVKYIATFGDQKMGLFTTYIGRVRYTPEEMSVWRYNVPGSWTKRNINTTTENKIAYFKRRLTFYKKIKSICDKKYYQVITSKQLSIKIALAKARNHKLNAFILRSINKLHSIWVKHHPSIKNEH